MAKLTIQRFLYNIYKLKDRYSKQKRIYCHITMYLWQYFKYVNVLIMNN